jgi:hypothetical protein
LELLIIFINKHKEKKVIQNLGDLQQDLNIMINRSKIIQINKKDQLQQPTICKSLGKANQQKLHNQVIKSEIGFMQQANQDLKVFITDY